MPFFRVNTTADDRILMPSAEISLADHCNLKCGGCSHASPHLPERMTEPEVIRQDLAALSRVFRSEELRVAGGEPLLNPHLVPILEIVKQSGITDKVVLISNGVLFPKMPEEVWPLIDKLWISVYPGIKVDVDAIEKDAEARGVELSREEMPQFAKTMRNSETQSKRLVKRIYDNCYAAHLWSCHLIYEGYYYKCAQAAFIPERQRLRGDTVIDRHQDGVKLVDNPNLRSDLWEYIHSDQPLRACSFCLGTMGTMFDHHQLNKSRRQDELFSAEGNIKKDLQRGLLWGARILGARNLLYLRKIISVFAR